MSLPYSWASRSVPFLGSQPPFPHTCAITNRCHTVVESVLVVAAAGSGSEEFLGGQLTSGVSVEHTRNLAKGTRIVASCGLHSSYERSVIDNHRTRGGITLLVESLLGRQHWITAIQHEKRRFTCRFLLTTPIREKNEIAVARPSQILLVGKSLTALR